MGYTKTEFSLMATPQKALFDLLYLISKSLKTEQYLDEMDFSILKKENFTQYLDLVSNITRLKMTKLLKKYL